MKKLIIGLLLLPCTLLAQSDSLLTFKNVVPVDGANKTQLFERARLWFTDYYKSAKAVLQVSDKESGELIGKPIISVPYSYKTLGGKYTAIINMNATIRILVKDGRYKYEIYDLIDPVSFGAFTISDICPKKFPMQKQSKTNLMWQDAKSNLNKEITLIINSLNTYMIDKGSIMKDDF